MDKLDIVFDLIQEGAIDVEEAKVLLEKEKEYIYSYPINYGYWPYYYPYYCSSPTITYCNSGSISTGLTSGSITCTNTSFPNNITFTSCSYPA